MVESPGNALADMTHLHTTSAGYIPTFKTFMCLENIYGLQQTADLTIAMTNCPHTKAENTESTTRPIGAMLKVGIQMYKPVVATTMATWVFDRTLDLETN